MANSVVARLIQKSPRGQERPSASRRYLNEVVGIGGKFYSDTSNAVYDPASVVLAFTNPAGTTTTYTYGVDSQLVKRTTGDYYVNVTADKYGRWTYTWTATGPITGTGSFFVGINPYPTK